MKRTVLLLDGQVVVVEEFYRYPGQDAFKARLRPFNGGPARWTRLTGLDIFQMRLR